MGKKANEGSSRATGPNRSPILSLRTRNIPALVRLVLFVRAGGRCEFDGCNRYLLEHPVTLTEGNFAEVAHVVAFKPDGPRGNQRPRFSNINDIGNLMLLCPDCHKLIDSHPGDYTRHSLEEIKSRHESRIRHVTGLGPDQKTSLLVVLAPIGKQTVALPFDDVLEAVSPRYPISRHGTRIDLTQLPGEAESFIVAARDAIQQKVAHLFEPGGEVEQTGHISLFALAPIPLLVFLGSQLSNKVALDIYQRHRDSENWTWKKSGNPVEFEFGRLRAGTDQSRVALVLSLSGTIKLQSLPSKIDPTFTVYELTSKDVTPSPTLLRTRRDLENFRTAYQVALGTIMREHTHADSLHVFPAIPAPVAVLCGRELLPKVHPELLVYDSDSGKGGFQFQLKVNNHESQRIP
jgi:hypothetical protein